MTRLDDALNICVEGSNEMFVPPRNIKVVSTLDCEAGRDKVGIS